MTANDQPAATPLESAFARWCAEADYTEDFEAPHGEAFRAGFLACSAAVLEIAAKPQPFFDLPAAEGAVRNA